MTSSSARPLRKERTHDPLVLSLFYSDTSSHARRPIAVAGASAGRDARREGVGGQREHAELECVSAVRGRARVRADALRVVDAHTVPERIADAAADVRDACFDLRRQRHAARVDHGVSGGPERYDHDSLLLHRER